MIIGGLLQAEVELENVSDHQMQYGRRVILIHLSHLLFGSLLLSTFNVNS